MRLAEPWAVGAGPLPLIMPTPHSHLRCSWRSRQIWRNGGGSAQPSGSCSGRSWNERRRLWHPNASVLSGKTTRRTGYSECQRGLGFQVQMDRGRAHVEAGVSVTRHHWLAQGCVWVGNKYQLWLCSVGACVQGWVDGWMEIEIYINVDILILMFAQRFYIDSSMSLCQSSGL